MDKDIDKNHTEKEVAKKVIWKNKKWGRYPLTFGIWDILLLPIWLVKFLIPSFLKGTPNVWTNIRLIFTKKEFRPLRMAMVSWLVFFVVLIQGGIFYFKNAPPAETISYTWFQTGWVASSTDSATNESNRNGWTKYWDVYPTNITTTTGTELTLKTAASSTTHTTTAEFNQG